MKGYFENMLESGFTKEVVNSYADMGFVAYLSNLTACVCITALAMAVFRRVFGNRFRTGWRCALWVILPLIFLIPIKIATPITVLPLLQLNFAVTIDPIKQEYIEGVTDILRHGTYTSTDGILFYELFTWIWLAVSAPLIIKEAVRYALLKKDIDRRGKKCTNEQLCLQLKEICGELKIKQPELICYPISDTPFAMGIIRPRIILPSEDYSAEEAGFILRHEAVHIKRRDIFTKLMLTLFRCLNWFNPFAYLLCRQAFEDMEINCDEKATESFTHEQRGDYSAAILKGVSRKKFPTVTTYLSSDAKSLKKRITAVMSVKKLGSVIPFIMVFAVVNTLAASVYAFPDDPHGYYAYVVPYPMEADPYVTSEDWRSCTAYSAEHAAQTIFNQYMQMYMGEDVPDYYRINSYCIDEITLAETGIFKTEKGIFNTNDFVEIKYSAEFANHCGNTVHNKNFGFTDFVNGSAQFCHVEYELSHKEDQWTLENFGTATLFGTCNYHFENALTGRFNTLETVQFMAESGMLDRSWDVYGTPPDPDAFVMYKYLKHKAYSFDDSPAVLSPVYDSPMLADLSNEEFINAVNSSTYLDPDRNIIADSYPFRKVQAVYCGYDFNAATGRKDIYFNIDGDTPYGVIITTERTLNTYNEVVPWGNLTRVTVTDEVFTPVEYHDSFLTADLPAGLTEYATAENAAAILEYMKTPRDGSDFTVLDYRNITETDEGIFAEVKFKGRLEGIYSSDILMAVNNLEKHKENSAYGIDLTGTVPESAYLGYLTVCVMK